MAWKSRIAAVAAMCAGCSSIHERYHLRVDPLPTTPRTAAEQEARGTTATGRPNYYRITICGWTFLSASQYAAGWYDRTAVESLFGEMKGDGKVVSVTGTRLPGHPTQLDPDVPGPKAPEPVARTSPQAGEEKTQPTVTSVDGSDLSGKRFVIFLASNADSLIEQIRSVVRSKQVQQSLIGLLLRDESEAYEKARIVAARSVREGRLLADQLESAKAGLLDLQDMLRAARLLLPILAPIELQIVQPLLDVLAKLDPSVNPNPELPEFATAERVLSAAAARLTSMRDVTLLLSPSDQKTALTSAYDNVATRWKQLRELMRVLTGAGVALQPPPQVEPQQLTMWVAAVRSMQGKLGALERIDATWQTQLASLADGLAGFDRANEELRHLRDRSADVGLAVQAVERAKAIVDDSEKRQAAREARDKLKPLVGPANVADLDALQFDLDLAGNMTTLEAIANRTNASVNEGLATARTAAEKARDDLADARRAVHNAALTMAIADLQAMKDGWEAFSTTCSEVRTAALNKTQSNFNERRTAILKALAGGSRQPPPADGIRDAPSARQWLADNPNAFRVTEAK